MHHRPSPPGPLRSVRRGARRETTTTTYTPDRRLAQRPSFAKTWTNLALGLKVPTPSPAGMRALVPVPTTSSPPAPAQVEARSTRAPVRRRCSSHSAARRHPGEGGAAARCEPHSAPAWCEPHSGTGCDPAPPRVLGAALRPSGALRARAAAGRGNVATATAPARRHRQRAAACQLQGAEAAAAASAFCLSGTGVAAAAGGVRALCLGWCCGGPARMGRHGSGGGARWPPARLWRRSPLRSPWLAASRCFRTRRASPPPRPHTTGPSVAHPLGHSASDRTLPACHTNLLPVRRPPHAHTYRHATQLDH